MVNFFKNFKTLYITIGFPSNAPYKKTIDPGKRGAIKALVIGPPPKASNKQSNLCIYINCWYYLTHPLVVTIICFAPKLCNFYLCYYFLTILRRGMFYLLHIFMSIFPRDEDDAVLIIPYLHPRDRNF